MTEETKKDRRLIPADSLTIIPALAMLIQDREALILQRVHYWLQTAEDKKYNFKDGYYWTYNSINKWQQKDFPHLSPSTVKRAFNNLVKAGILVTGNYNKMKGDRSKWYRIDYGRLFIVLSGLLFCNFLSGVSIPLDQNDLMQLANLTQCHWAKTTSPIPNNSLPNNLANNSLGTGSDSSIRPILFDDFLKIAVIETELDRDNLDSMRYFMSLHQKRFGLNTHPKLKAETWQSVLSGLREVDDDGRLHEAFDEDLVAMINHYFNKEYQDGCNYSITHFNDPGIKKVNYYEAAF